MRSYSLMCSSQATCLEATSLNRPRARKNLTSGLISSHSRRERALAKTGPAAEVNAGLLAASVGFEASDQSGRPVRHPTQCNRSKGTKSKYEQTVHDESLMTARDISRTITSMPRDLERRECHVSTPITFPGLSTSLSIGPPTRRRCRQVSAPGSTAGRLSGDGRVRLKKAERCAKCSSA